MIVLDIDGVVSDTYQDNIFENIDESTLSSLDIKNAKPFEDAWYWINHYSSIYDIMFITSRDKRNTAATWEWFRDWDIPVDFVVFEPDRIQFLAQINPTVYIDDNQDNVSAALDVGVNAILLDAEYNMESSISSKFRVSTLWDIECV